uniref:Uncharacterized protein n=1 Tax=Picea glauca TaxID=3330 RepID=A0A101M081_PICGL|nr:hypothetical protein ABT39_MTgene4527 [Picea glauca]
MGEGEESVITYIIANLEMLSKLIELASSPVGREFAASPSSLPSYCQARGTFGRARLTLPLLQLEKKSMIEA